MTRLMRAWNIFRKSLNLLSSERKLLIFPLISGLAMITLILLIICGGAACLILLPETTEEGDLPEIAQTAFYLVFFILYLFVMFVSNFCMSAFFSEISRGMSGDSVSIGRGLSFATSRWKAIFLWSLLASTVGVILSMLEERLSFLGQIVLKLIGVVWAVASCFAIPALVCSPELNTPFEILKRSALTIKKTWGESLAGFIGLHVISGVATLFWLLATIVIVGLCILANMSFVWVLGLVMIVGLLIALFLFAYLVNAAQAVYTVALYRYAEFGENGIFSQDELGNAFKRKK